MPQSQGPEEGVGASRALDEAAMQLRFFAYDAIGRMYAGFMFEIVRDYPETEAAVADCAACMKRTSLHQHMVDTLTASIRARLLHPGARLFVFGYCCDQSCMQRITCTSARSTHCPRRSARACCTPVCACSCVTIPASNRARSAQTCPSARSTRCPRRSARACCAPVRACLL
jgi:hypothetical protein